MRRALITGIAGQDGTYLAKFLLEKGYNVFGFNKQRTSLENHAVLGILGKVSIIDGDITDSSSVDMALKISRPHEIYNLAAQSHVGYSFDTPYQTCAVNFTGYLNILYGARKNTPWAKIYQAGTSEMFGYAAGNVANENTPFQPKSPYAISKVAAHWSGVNARHEAGQFVANGILFNHESPIRHPYFVTRKITMGIAKLMAGSSEPLRLGNIDSVRDWGFAGDYVEAMWLMLQHDRPDDFVVATGKKHTVREFIELAFYMAGGKITFNGSGVDEKGYMDGKVIMEIDKKFYRPNDLTYLCGDASKAKSVLGWEPKTTLEQLVKLMVRSEV